MMEETGLITSIMIKKMINQMEKVGFRREE